MEHIRLGVNIDHVATLRNARGETWPDPLRAALLVEQAGADGITLHLREDRRHIRDQDVFLIKEASQLPINLEMAATEEMVQIALKVQPTYVCIVPEKRHEVTTEGGLDVVANQSLLLPIITQLKNAGIKVSLFVDPQHEQIEIAEKLGVDAIELHTGKYSSLEGVAQQVELDRLMLAAKITKAEGLHCHAGHGLTFANVEAIAAIKEIEELNIGHFIISEAIFSGLTEVITQMRNVMHYVRKKTS